jgi:hypothetical protein
VVFVGDAAFVWQLARKVQRKVAQPISFHFVLKSDAGKVECDSRVRNVTAMLCQDLRNEPCLKGRSRLLQRGCRVRVAFRGSLAG